MLVAGLLGIIFLQPSLAVAQQYRKQYLPPDPYAYADSLLVKNSRLLKADVFAPLTGDITLGFEHFITPWLSLVHTAGLTALQAEGDVTFNKGFFVRNGFKLPFRRRVADDGFAPPHLLLGTYAMLEVGYFAMQDPDRRNGTGLNKATGGSIMLVIGKQQVVAGRFVIDYRVGMGGATGDLGTDVYAYFAAVDSGLDGTPNLIFHAGFEFGFITSKRKKQ